MTIFINMDFDGNQWWVDYNDGEDKRNYYNTESEAYEFYYSIT